MTAPRPVAPAALAAPLLMLGYGLFRVIDGLDGSHGPGPAWDIGHVLFFAAFICFGVLLVGLRHIAVERPGRRRAANVLLALGLAGVAAFLWVIVGDLIPTVDARFGAPDAVQAVGPLLFLSGTVGLLTLLAVSKTGPVRLWSPALVLLGFVAITVNIDLLPVAALLFLCGLAPLIRTDIGTDIRTDIGPDGREPQSRS